MQREIDDLRNSQDKVRKKLFAQYVDLSKLYIETQEELDGLKSLLYKIQKNDSVKPYRGETIISEDISETDQKTNVSG